jgi:hypothetical protein
MRWIGWLTKEEGPLPKKLNSVGAALPAYRQAGAAARFTPLESPAIYGGDDRNKQYSS